jgi:signal transduction histidine kinase
MSQRVAPASGAGLSENRRMLQTGPSARRRILASGLAVWVLTLVVGFGWGGVLRVVAANLGYAALFAMVAWGSFTRAAAEAPARTGWRLLGSAGVAGTLTGLWFTAQVFVPALRQASLPAVSLLGLGALLLTCSAMLTWPLAPAEGSSRVRAGLDGVIFAAASLFAFWAVAVEHLSPAGPRGSRDVLFLAIYVGTAAVLGIVIYLASPLRRLQGPLGWVAAAYALSFLSEALFASLALAGRWYAAHPSELIALARWIPLAVAPWAPPFRDDRADVEEASDLRDALVYAPVAIALSAGIARGLTTGTPLTPFAAVLLVLLGSGVLLRQFLALRDVRALSRTLERRVETRTRELEDARRELERTRRLEALGRLASGVAHDFNNLLTAITANAASAAEALETSDPVRAEIERIEQAALRGSSLTGQLLSFGRQRSAAGAPLQLNAAVDALVSFLSRTLGARYELTATLGPAVGAVVVEAGEIDQLLTNLVVNARDAMPEGGRIDVRTELYEVGGDLARVHDVRPGPYASLVVADAGRGIDDDVRDRIFEPFFTTKPEGKGTGLGLASCYGIASRAGGFIALESAPAGGASFRVCFPSHERPAA